MRASKYRPAFLSFVAASTFACRCPAQTLLARDFVVDSRPGAGIRVAPHYYTSDEELDAAVAAIDDILTTGAWRRFAGHSSVVT